ncbi:MAG TPA: PPOX class F420-dependent oxidoreductase [Rubrobacteraceae bacterium]|nr:PPOX class F420-dependent oxidoreductase [Rubrobacteraceae bacterium]
MNLLLPGREGIRTVANPLPATVHKPRDLGETQVRSPITYRKNGETDGSPVRFVLIDDWVYVTTPPRSAKIKRICNDPRVLLVPCNARGVPLGANIEGVARIVEDAAPERIRTALRHRYRLGLKLFRLLGQHDLGQIRLEIRPAVTALDPPVPRFSS